MTVPSSAMLDAAARSRITADHFLALLAIGLFVLVYLLPLGERPLWTPDETRYAEIPREMLTTGDWVVPRLNGLRYFEKPPLGYWLNAASIGLLGENNFGVRLPTALAAGLTALLVLFLAKAAGVPWRSQLLGAAVYLTTAEVYLLGAFTTLDGFLTLWITAGILAFHRAVTQSERSAGQRWAAAAGLAFALAFLTKGFLAFVIPGLVLLPWLLWSGNFRVAMTRLWPCAAVAVLVVLPWALAIHAREGDFWRYFIWEEHIRRFMGDNAQHEESSLYFVKLLPVLAFPWIFLLPATIAGLRVDRQTGERREFLCLLWLWALLPFVFFSISRGKLSTYILPCFAPFAALTAVGLRAYLESGRRRLFDYGQLVLAVLFISLLVVLLVSQQTGFPQVLYRADEKGSAVLFGAALMAGAISCIFAARLDTAGSKLTASVLCMIPLLATIEFVMPSTLVERNAPARLFSRIAATVPRDAVLLSDTDVVRAVGWYFKSDDVYILSRYGELEYGLGFPDAAGRSLNPKGFRKMLADDRRRHDVVLICEESCGEKYEKALPPDSRRYEYGVYRVWHVPRI